MAQPTKEPKAMSSRLATMKFMQRSGTASPSSTPSTPAEPPSKRQRLSTGSFNSTPSATPRVHTPSTGDSPSNAATGLGAADRDETKWYLSFKQPNTPATESPLRVIRAGYSSLDSAGTRPDLLSENEGNETARPKFSGRKSFGKFNKTIERQQNPDLSSSDSGDGDSASEGDSDSENDSDDPSGAKALITAARKEAGDKARAERKVKKSAEKAEALRLADERRKKYVKLNKLTGISSGGGGGGGGGPDMRKLVCHTCGKTGHFQRDCSEQRRDRRR
ncbi:hypothetical protein LTR62_005162 [Meristemomyces frigidus]|uniref:CCHC-type domain-containing protein n=1 Tax=Meristemomyces frigidus TaxID=1508187 RepID=A0AAN7YR19_9PEZI|nr:hypothetical protein LTR62_005162 [Meristemomyces frigidus]